MVSNMVVSIKLLLTFFLTLAAASESFLQTNNSQYIGVIDRMEGNSAVILLEEIEVELVLPAQGLGEFAEKDQWLLFQMEKGKPVSIHSLPEVKEERKTKMMVLIDRLRMRKK